ncbi:nucleotidyltransferase family protein [Longirhabdus pacifica]|uniref:nucleotidyltransferase family protein n=1 Tax=Longirhabdus pacifica TaxID=2305227 RepID=UPI0010093C52|nr:nucleotidyltransferase family protein [Longirhabdus pacifica]
MEKKDIEKILKEQKNHLYEHFFVNKIGLFGSYARNEHHSESDIDILVEFYKPVGFLFFDLKDYLESLFNKKVDLVTVNALKPILKQDVLNEVQFQ